MELVSALTGGMVFLGYLGELESDLTLALKIIVLLTIISFIIQHVGKGPLAIILVVAISGFVIFDFFMFFGGMFVLYILLSFGATGILIDFFFVNPGSGGGGEPPADISHGVDFAQRQASYQQARNRQGAAQKRIGR